MQEFNRTIVIAITDPNNTQTFAHAPTTINYKKGKNDTVRILIHKDPYHPNPSVPANFDILFNIVHEDFLKTHFRNIPKDDGYLVVNSIRYNKLEQQRILRNFNKSLKDSYRFEVIPSAHINNWASSVLLTLSEFLVVKPLNGAKGEGHLVIEPHRLYTLNGTMTVPDDATHTICTDNTTAIITLGERETPLKENNKVSFNPYGDYIVQPLVEDITEEYRIIIAGRSIAGIYKRDLKTISNHYKQANLDLNNINDKEPAQNLWNGILNSKLAEFYSKQLKPVIDGFVEYTGMIHGSIDIYVKEGRGFGIIEFSNEFGIVGYNRNVTRHWLVQTLTTMVEEYDEAMK